jgi:transcription termination/antitermination protein NusG
VPIEEPPENRTDAPDAPSDEEVVPPPDRAEAEPGPTGEQAPGEAAGSAGEEDAPEPGDEPGPEDVGSPEESTLPEEEEDAAEPAPVEPIAAEVEEGLAEPPEVPESPDGAVEPTPESEEPEAPQAPERQTPAAAAREAAPPEGDGSGPAAVAPAEEAPTGADPFGGPGDWYVIHTYAGYENKVKTNLESRIHTMQMEDKIFDVHVPMEDVMEIKGGKKQVVQKKVFPGYLLVKMVYDDDSWYVVRNTPGVTGFVSSGTGQKPTPLSRREVEKILAVKEEEAKKPAFRLEFEEGDVVRIISGPFADFNGTISDINVDQSKLRVMVNIFDRETPVELGFDQVAKV